MSIAEIIKKLEMAYNEEDWGNIEELIESLSVISEIDDPFMWEDGDDEID